MGKREKNCILLSYKTILQSNVDWGYLKQKTYKEHLGNLETERKSVECGETYV